MKAVLLLVVLAFGLAAAHTMVLENQEAHMADPNEVSISQLNLHSTTEGQRAQVVFGVQNEDYSVGAHSKGFYIKHGKDSLLKINKYGEVLVLSESFSANSLAADELIVAGVPQFKMVALDMFESQDPLSLGWNTNSRVQCAGLSILTGDALKRSPEEAALVKIYDALPPHDQLRITATAHFVDDWQGETAYLKINDHYVWTQGHDQRNSQGKVNVCGREAYPEGRFSVPIDVSIPHTASNFTIAFGSTLPAGAVADFGISSVAVHLRRANLPAAPIKK